MIDMTFACRLDVRRSMCVCGASVFAQDNKSAEKLAPYYPTPPFDREKDACRLQGCSPAKRCSIWAAETDALCCAAASKFKANATGVELDESLARQSSEEIRRRGLEDRAYYSGRYSQAGLFVRRRGYRHIFCRKPCNSFNRSWKNN